MKVKGRRASGRVLFSKLTPAEIERLVNVIEEAAEVQQIAAKVLRHGFESRHPFKPHARTNREELERELGNLGTAAELMVAAGDVARRGIKRGAEDKIASMIQYTHAQPKRLFGKLRDQLGAWSTSHELN